jgi:hypothetical protein
LGGVGGFEIGVGHFTDEHGGRNGGSA